VEPSKLSARERELVEAFVAAWEASSHTPFAFGHTPFEHPSWPAGVRVPGRQEVRRLLALDCLELGRSAPGAWRVFPSAAARELAGAAENEALADPDRRLGLILEATVTAFEADPAEALQFLPVWGSALVRHPHWQLQPEVVKPHDLQQLADLGLVATDSGDDTLVMFWPTVHGRAAVGDAPGYLERVARETDDEEEQSRLRRAAKHLRVGDVAVGAAAGTVSGALIRALVGL